MPFRTSGDIGWQERDGQSGWYGARGRTPASGGGASLTKSVSLSSRVRSDVEPRPEGQISWINCVNILTWAPCFQRQFGGTRCVLTNLLLSVRIFIVSDLFGRTCKHIGIKHVRLISFDVSLYRIELVTHLSCNVWTKVCQLIVSAYRCFITRLIINYQYTKFLIVRFQN